MVEVFELVVFFCFGVCGVVFYFVVDIGVV